MTPRHEYNWRCPHCGSRDEISLVVHVDAQINDGEMEYTAPPMWPPDAQVFCGECGHEGVPADFGGSQQP